MRLESCKTLLDSFSPDRILVVQMDTTGSNIESDHIIRLTACTMDGERILNIDDVNSNAEDISSKINKFFALIGSDLFERLLPFLAKAGVNIDVDVGADLQKEWNEIIGTYNSLIGDWNRISLSSLAGTYHFRPHPEQYPHEFNKVYSYVFLTEKAAEIGSISLKGTRRSQLQIYRKTQKDISHEHPVF